MAPGAKQRSQLMRRRLDDVVAAHRQLSAGEHIVIVVVDADRRDELADAIIANSEDHDSVLACLPIARARTWLADVPAIDKWSEQQPDAMDVAIVAAGGVTVMRLTAR